MDQAQAEARIHEIFANRSERFRAHLFNTPFRYFQGKTLQEMINEGQAVRVLRLVEGLIREAMSNRQIIERVNQWQGAGFVHPLTCGNNSQHQNLIPRELAGEVVLVCPDCDYVQLSIPGEVLSDHVDRMKEVIPHM